MSLERRGNRFVVQQHKAKNTHWDLRLEIGDKMLSWAIPKGPSINPKETRLAVLTKPHDIAYNEFEGVIAKGLYGAGKVLQWDKGTYNFIDKHRYSKDMFRDGLLKFNLHGEKLKGGWALLETNQNWLLIKMNDKYAKRGIDIVKSEKNSVKSGKTIEKITKDDGLIIKQIKLGWD
jgi:DNA ligase D-like protein (predicted 3'-phosphoesterase)